FDAVIARQGLSDRATPESVLELLGGIAAVQCPGANRNECGIIATHVIDGLTNSRERERQFQLQSVIYAPDYAGGIVATSVPRSFWLLREQKDPTSGKVYLDDSADAVNALVGGLDIPIAD